MVNSVFLPVMNILLLAGEHLHQGLPHLLVDEDVEDGVDKTIEICEGNNLLQNYRAVLPHHEYDGVGPPAY